MSTDGKKIATSPFIAKFGMSAKSDYLATVPDKDDNVEAESKSETITKTFGFRRVKR